MTASLVLNSIRSALNGLKSSPNFMGERDAIKYRLKNLEIFVLCARKLGNDAQLRIYDGKVTTLAALFQRILDVLSRYPPPYNNFLKMLDFERAIDNLKEEIRGWYNALLFSLAQPTLDEVTDFIDSVLENLNYLGSRYDYPKPDQLLEALIEKIRFLRNFIRFVTLRCVEPLQLDNLLAHIQAVAVDATHTCWFYISRDYGVKEEYGVVPNNIAVLFQMIKMVNPQVDETYTQALTSSKLSTRFLSPIPDKDHDPLVVMKDFIDSLLSILCERLQTDTHIVIPTKSELQLVEEGLRLLSIMLQAQPNIFDKKFGELSRVVICDAGILIFSLYQRDMEIAVPTSGLLQRINRITQIVKGKDFSIPDLLQRISRFRRLSDINMMASLVINSIRSALEAFVRPPTLKSLEVFVMCARKLSNDAQLRFYDGKVTTLASLFQKILDALSRCAAPYSDILRMLYLKPAIDNFREEIRGWYNALLFSLPQPTLDEVKGFIDSVLENLNYHRFPHHHYSPELHQTIEALIKKIRFLRSFIRFATLRSVEPPQLLDNLLAHIHAVAVDAAHTCWFYISRENGVKGEYGVVPNIPVLLQMIKMVDPQVDETYTKALTSFKLSMHLISPIPDEDRDPWDEDSDPSDKDSDPSVIPSDEDSDPSVIPSDEDRDPWDEDSDPSVEDSDPSDEDSDPSDEDSDPSIVIMNDFIDSLLWNLWERLHMDTPIVISTNSELQLVYDGLSLLRSLLEVQPYKFDKRIEELTRVVICDAGIIIFSLYQREMEIDVPVPDSGLLQRINGITQIVKGKDFSIPDLLQRISRIASNANMMASVVLNSVIMKDFIDFLLSNLWERLHMDTPIVISANSDLRLVYGGLRLLRIMLEKQPKNFDKRIEELTRVMICDAGIIIFSLYPRDMEIDVPTSGLLQRINRNTQIVRGIDFSIPDFLQRINRIRQRVEGKDLSIPDLQQRLHGSREQVGGNYLPRTNELGFIDFVLENLLGLISSKTCYGTHSQFRMIHDELSLLRSSLGKIEGPHNEQKELAVKVAYRVEFLIDQLEFGDFQGSSPTSFDSTVKDILKEVKSINSKIPPATDIKVKKVSMPPNPGPLQNRVPVADEIVGLNDGITSIINRLIRGSKELKMVAIVGMPGVGKTTLATKVFNHSFVTHRFQVCLWCCVSQLFHKKNLILELLSLVDPDTNRNIEKSEQDLSEKLWKHLKGKRYLIFLDDVWDIEAWDSFKESFPDDFYGSRILVTSRHRDAVPQPMLDEEPHFLDPLTDDQSLELLQKKLSPRNGWSWSLSDIGRQIAANCKGLPLALVVTAGLLANMEPEDWRNILEDLTVVANAEPCMNTFESSYKHLPGQLKECFLYFGLFPEDHEVSVKRLIRLWIAEGFVRETESNSLEDVARAYILELARRSLVIVSKERSRGGVKACRIHDLLHDFCRTKAKEENFFQLLKGYDELLLFEEPSYMRRLCFHCDYEVKYFKSLRPFCPRLHSLLFFNHATYVEGEVDISFIIPSYSRLRVLDTSQYLLSFNFGFPNEFGFLLQLKYLSVTVTVAGTVARTRYTICIPSSIGNLANLETLILHSYGEKVSLPDTFWNLQKLRHVDIMSGFHLSFENLERFPDLCELQSCSDAIIPRGESIEKLVRKFPNIRKLRCRWEDPDIKISTLDFLRQLESLDLTSYNRLQFVFPDNLRKLTLRRVFFLQQSDVSRIGELPHLEVLKFRGVSFKEDTWAMEEGEFSTLRFLELSGSSIVRWTASDDQFPDLQKLVLRSCNYLKEFPCCFESNYTLEMVDVKDCCCSLNSFFKGIEDEQKKSGNVWTKIQIS